MTAAAKQALAQRLVRLAGEMHIASGEIEAVGWSRHALQLSGMASLASIYAHQLRAGVVLTVDEALQALEDEIGGAK